MTSNQKLLTLLLGAISAILIVAQMALGELIRKGENLRDVHVMSGRLTFLAVSVYIGLTIWFVINTPTRSKTA